LKLRKYLAGTAGDAGIVPTHEGVLVPPSGITRNLKIPRPYANFFGNPGRSMLDLCSITLWIRLT
jgi:hypothetical protein